MPKELLTKSTFACHQKVLPCAPKSPTQPLAHTPYRIGCTPQTNNRIVHSNVIILAVSVAVIDHTQHFSMSIHHFNH